VKVVWMIDSDQARCELTPETITDKAIIDGLGNAQTASVKRNGNLTFILELPKQPVIKPPMDRPRDEVRDQL
jgi:hypothetical protein